MVILPKYNFFMKLKSQFVVFTSNHIIYSLSSNDILCLFHNISQRFLINCSRKKKYKLVDQSHLYLTSNCNILLYLYSMNVEMQVLVLLRFYFQGLNPNYIDQSNPVLQKRFSPIPVNISSRPSEKKNIANNRFCSNLYVDMVKEKL